MAFTIQGKNNFLIVIKKRIEIIIFIYFYTERQSLGIHGLMPATVLTQDAQEKLVLENLNRLATDLDRYVYLMHLLDRNEKLFYKVLSSNVEDIMPLVYTPTVGEACIKYGFIYNQPKGMFISITDKGHIHDVLLNWPVDDVKVKLFYLHFN